QWQSVPPVMVDVMLRCFFFQAEDGIRDRNVTGVQTCALPIWITRPTQEPTAPRCCKSTCPAAQRWCCKRFDLGILTLPRQNPWRDRKSVRVGKEWRSRWATCREEERLCDEGRWERGGACGMRR